MSEAIQWAKRYNDWTDTIQWVEVVQLKSDTMRKWYNEKVTKGKLLSLHYVPLCYHLASLSLSLSPSLGFAITWLRYHYRYRYHLALLSLSLSLSLGFAIAITWLCYRYRYRCRYRCRYVSMYNTSLLIFCISVHCWLNYFIQHEYFSCNKLFHLSHRKLPSRGGVPGASHTYYES